MAYNYATERAKLQTPEGQALLVTGWREADALLAVSGAFRTGEWMGRVTAQVGVADLWTLLAVVDWFIEQGTLVELTDATVWGQHRVCVRGQEERTWPQRVKSCPTT